MSRNVRKSLRSYPPQASRLVLWRASRFAFVRASRLLSESFDIANPLHLMCLLRYCDNALAQKGAKKEGHTFWAGTSCPFRDTTITRLSAVANTGVSGDVGSMLIDVTLSSAQITNTRAYTRIRTHAQTKSNRQTHYKIVSAIWNISGRTSVHARTHAQ